MKSKILLVIMESLSLIWAQQFWNSIPSIDDRRSHINNFNTANLGSLSDSQERKKLLIFVELYCLSNYRNQNSLLLPEKLLIRKKISKKK